MSDLIERQAAIDVLHGKDPSQIWDTADIEVWVNALPSAQPEIIRCKDCEYGEQDDIGRWFCNDLGCQIGSEDGSGYCANAERRTDD